MQYADKLLQGAFTIEAIKAMILFVLALTLQKYGLRQEYLLELGVATPAHREALIAAAETLQNVHA